MSRILLDSHALLWWVEDETKLSARAYDAIESANDIYVSVVSIWELAIKYRRGKLPLAESILEDVPAFLSEEDFIPLPISMIHAESAGLLPDIHRDPFDRMLIAQSMTEKLAFVSNETLFDQYGVNRIW